MQSNEAPAIVIDNGSYSVKAGLSDPNDDAPRVIMRTVVGHSKFDPTTNELYFGNEVFKKSTLKKIYPIEAGLIMNWDNMEKVWNYLFQQMGVKPENHRVLLTEPPLNPKQHKEKMAQIMFETFNAPAVFVAVQAALSLFSTGRTSGLVFDSGFDVSHIVPISNGQVLEKLIPRFDFAGRDLTNGLIKLLENNGYSFVTSAEREVISDIKEKNCYVANNFDKELENTNALKETYELPDGKRISICKERIKVPEGYFTPEIFGMQYDGIHVAINNVIMKCDTNIRKQMYGGIIMSGGSTMFPGFPKRLETELSALASNTYKVKIVAPADRKNMTWRGGSVLASYSGFRDSWISKQEYEEKGPTAIHRK